MKFPMPDHVIDLVNTWGKRFQKEKRINTVEFLNRRKLKFDRDSNKIIRGAVSEPEILAHPELPANFPGMELEKDMVGLGVDPVATIPASPEQDAHDAEVNTGLITPIVRRPMP